MKDMGKEREGDIIHQQRIEWSRAEATATATADGHFGCGMCHKLAISCTLSKERRAAKLISRDMLPCYHFITTTTTTRRG